MLAKPDGDRFPTDINANDGRFRTLEEVVQHYNFGGVTDQENEFRDEALEVLYLGEDDVDDLVRFLREGLTR